MFSLPADFDESSEIESLETPATSTSSTSKSKKSKASKGTHVGVSSTGFRDLMLRKELLRAIDDAAFEHPSPIQQETIPHAIHGMDVIAQAKSGYGKTAVFVLSVLQQLEESESKTSTLVIAHTRELAYQICKEFERFAKYMEWVKILVLIGGTPELTNIQSLKSMTPHIVVGTPGRILSMVKKNHLDLSNIKHFVIDECDKLLNDEDLEGRQQIQAIFLKTPQNKQTMMFTATLNEESRQLCRKFMNNPIEVFVNDENKLVLHGLQQYYVKLIEKNKNKQLVNILDVVTCNQIVIFVRSKARARSLGKALQSCNFPATSVHSGLPQAQRIKRYKDFKEGATKTLVSTDLAARGVDIDRVNLVINYDMPLEPKAADTYLHRVGRAGRFGTKGTAISFISSPDDAKVLDQVQNRFKAEITVLPESFGLESNE